MFEVWTPPRSSVMGQRCGYRGILANRPAAGGSTRWWLGLFRMGLDLGVLVRGGMRIGHGVVAGGNCLIGQA